MSLVKKILIRFGIVVAVSIAVSIAVMSASVGHATMASDSELTGATTNIIMAQEEEVEALEPLEPLEPLDVRIRQGINELGGAAKTTLLELGALDTPEKADQAIIILQRFEAGMENLNIKLHGRVGERWDEQNDLALARLYQKSAAEASTIGTVSTVEQIEQIDVIRVAWREQINRVEENFLLRQTLLAEEHDQRLLPQFDLGRQTHLEPSAEATEEEIEEFITGMREKAEAAVAELGELDTPGKIHRAENILAKTEWRIGQIDNPDDEPALQDLEAKFAERSAEFEARSQATVDALGGLDTSEKSEEAAKINARTQAAINYLNQQMGVNAHRRDEYFEGQFDEKVVELRQQTQDNLKTLGVLDTRRKFDLARLLQSRLDDGVRKLRINVTKAKRAAAEG